MLPLLTETRVAAQASSPATRLIVMVKGNGVVANTFWPTWASGRPVDGSLASATLPHVTAPLAPFRDRILFLDGLSLRNWLREEGNTTGDNGDAHHNWGSLLTGELPSDALFTAGGCRSQADPAGCRMAAGSVSLDCYVGQRLKESDPSLVYDSLHVALNSGDLQFDRSPSGLNCPSFYGRDRPNPPEPDPQAVYTRLFGGELPTGDNAEVSPAMRRRLRLLDVVGRDLERFVQRLGHEDRQVAEAHLHSVRQREDQLRRAVENRVVCARPTRPTVEFVSRRESHIPELSRVMMDMVVDAMKCGLARTAVYSMYDTNGYWAFFSWLKHINPNFENLGGPQVSEFPQAHYHAMAHGHGSEPGATMYRDANRWYIEQYAYLLARLASEPELDGTMLDRTLVLFVDSLSNGAGHTVHRLPWILAGDAKGTFRFGRHVQLPAGTAPNGLFVALAEAMGVAPPNEVFGNPRFGRGAMTELRG